MCIYIGIEDLVANAFIELVGNTQRREITYSRVKRYGATVVNVLTEYNQKAVLVITRETIDSLTKDYSNFFESYSNGIEEGIHLKEGITVDDLWERFRGYLSFDVMKAFSHKKSIEQLEV